MRTVTELGFTAPAFPERAAVQEAPAKGESFFDTLSRAGENAKDAAKVTDDKPETKQHDNENAETAAEKTQSENETPKAEPETEKKEQAEVAPDVVAQMLALGRMVTAVQPEQTVEANITMTESEAAVSVETVPAEGGEGDALMQMLTPVENGEEVQVIQTAEIEGTAITTENFADAMTQTLAEKLGEQPAEQPAAQPIEMELSEQPVGETVIQQDIEPAQTAEETEAQLPVVDAQPDEIAAAQMPAEEDSARTDTFEHSDATRVQKSGAPADMTPTEVVEKAETPENTDFSQMFEGEDEGFETETAAEQLTDASDTEIESDTVETVPMQQILRNRFAADGAVQNIDNTELAQAIEKAIDRFAEDFRIAEVDVQNITIRLDPEELGSMSITVAAENNVITAKIVTDNKEAASLLSAQIEQFLETMEQKGIKVDKAEVTYNSQLDLGSQTPNEHSGGTHGGRRTIEAISAVEMVEVEEEIRLDEAAVAAVQDEATNYYVFDDKYVPNHVYKV